VAVLIVRKHEFSFANRFVLPFFLFIVKLSLRLVVGLTLLSGMPTMRISFPTSPMETNFASREASLPWRPVR